MLALVLDSLDPARNLALEEYLFSTLPPDHPGWFLLWRNGPSIIVGRHQNTLEEINPALVEKHGLQVVRRMTGGGAVYHDAGNLNFSFLHWVERGGPLDFSLYLQPVVRALADIGVTAEFSSRNDLTAGGRKFSGSAQMRQGRRVLHHGTLMVELDLDMLGAVLTGAPDKYLSKGIASVRSRVINLAELWPAGTRMDDLRDALVRHCATGQGSLAAEDAAAAAVLAQDKYRSWNWNYGASPRFTEKLRERFPWGAVECRLDVRHGNIEGCRIQGDFFAAAEVAELESLLTGVRHRPEDIRAALAQTDMGVYFAGCDAERMLAFFAGELLH